MKRAMVLVSFGTSHNRARELSIGSLQEELKEKYPEYDHYLAFTSGVVRKILERRGEHIPAVEELLENLTEKGYEEVVIVPTHLLEGDEYKKVTDSAKNFKKNIDTLLLVKPAFATEEDMERIIGFLENKFDDYLNPETFLLLMGHGSESKAGKMYSRFNQKLKEAGHFNTYIACVEGSPDFTDALSRIKKSAIRKVTVIPFMYVAGDHVLNDLLGEGGWVEKLKNNGYAVTPLRAGLGEYPEYREILKENIEKTLKNE